MRPQTGPTPRVALLALACTLALFSGRVCLAQDKASVAAPVTRPGAAAQSLKAPKTDEPDRRAKPPPRQNPSATETTTTRAAPKFDDKSVADTKPESEPFRAHPNMKSPDCYKDPVHDRADLCAQWRAALAAEDAAKNSQEANDIARYSLVFSVLGFLALLYTLHLARQSNLDNRAIGQCQTRCYLSLDALQLYVDDADGKPRVMVALRNSGASPALDVTWSAILTYRLAGAAKPRVSQTLEAANLRPSIAPNTSLDMPPIALDFALTTSERAAVLQTGESLGVEVALIVKAIDVFEKEVRLDAVFAGAIHDAGIWMALAPTDSKPARSVTTP